MYGSAVGRSDILVVHATFPIEPEHRDEAMDAIRELAEASRAEEGVLDYRVAADVEDESLVRFFERYEDEAAFGAHAESAHFERFETALPEYLAGKPAVTRFDVGRGLDVDL